MLTNKMSTDIMSNRQNVERTKCRTDKMSTDKMSNRQNVEQTKCRQTKCRTDKMSNRKKISLADWIFPWTFFSLKSRQIILQIFSF